MNGILSSSGMLHDRKRARPGRQVFGQELAIQVAGDAQGQDVDDRAADDLVGLELDRDHRVQRGQHHRGQHTRQDGQPAAQVAGGLPLPSNP